MPRAFSWALPLLAALAAALAVTELGYSSSAGDAGATLTTIRQIGSYEVLDVTRSGRMLAVYAAAAGACRCQLYRSDDEGQSWAAVGAPFPNQVQTIAELHSGTLIASTDAGNRIWRSADQGSTWQPVRIADPSSPGTYRATLPLTPVHFQTLEKQSVADDGTFAYLAAYSTPAAAGTTTYVYSETANPAYIWRSSDDGRTWDVANATTTHKHIHAVFAQPGGPLYVAFGDKGGNDGIFVSTDHGQTLSPLCTNRPLDNYCIDVAGTFTADGTALVSTSDVLLGASAITSLNLASGVVSVVSTIPYPAFTDATLPDGSILVGSYYQAIGGYTWNDPNLHLYVVAGGVATQVASYPIRSTAQIQYLEVEGVFPNGDAALLVSGFGTWIVHVTTRLASPLPTTTAPTATQVTTTTTCGP
jgi:hypothetical protein